MPPLQILGPPTSSPSGTGWERPENSTPRNPAREDPPELCNWASFTEFHSVDFGALVVTLVLTQWAQFPIDMMIFRDIWKQVIF